MTTDKTSQVAEVKTYKVFQSRLLVDPHNRLNPDCHHKVVIYANVAALLGERDRLRNALVKIANQGPELNPEWKHWSDIAREALEGASA
ncbi:hypothetical protein [Xylophilus sp.]|uniref:hypothetical protein n=1 Tax=Xylophilus sp. TaxID=2653893 RepID=UPI0013B720AE|nr:hypothetical protein [Xylophilus sp.]KAF1045651.1 MAG: hypothetical protein GAK38_02943 [Xylophilus sp.]